MAIPSAPSEGGGNKITFLTYDASGTNTAAIPVGVAHKSLNGTQVAYAGVGTHGDGDAWVAGGPVVVLGGYDSTGNEVLKLLADSSGHLAIRPLGAYDGGSALAFGHPTLVGGGAVHGEQLGALSVATHVVGGTVSSGHPAVLKALSAGGTAVAALGDTDGRTITSGGYTFTGQGHVAFTSGAAVKVTSGATLCRKVKIIADSGNSAPVYIGKSTVTADNAAATGGFQLPAGKDIEIIADALDLSTLYVRSTAAVGASFLYFS